MHRATRARTVRARGRSETGATRASRCPTCAGGMQVIRGAGPTFALLFLFGAAATFAAEPAAPAQPVTLAWGKAVLSKDDAWYASPEARAVADSVLKYQSA